MNCSTNPMQNVYSVRMGVLRYLRAVTHDEKIRNLNDDCNSSLELLDLAHERKFVT